MEAEDCAFYRFINVITHLGKGCKSRARGKRFANFSRVLFTSQMDCYAGKPMESAIYYWCNFSNDMHDQFNDKKKSVKLIMVSWFQCLIEPNSYTMFRKTTVIKTKKTNILKDTEYWLGLQLWNLNWTGFWMTHRPCMVFIFTLRILMFFLFSPFAGHRNKWKRMFFVLDGDEQHLYFFENEKVWIEYISRIFVTKPWTVIRHENGLWNKTPKHIQVKTKNN